MTVPLLAYIILFSLVGGAFSLVGGILLLVKKQWSHETMLIFISFAAGVLLAVSFGDLLPEALEMGEELGLESHDLLVWPLIAMVGFFIFERSFMWFHHHYGPHEDHPDPVTPMVWLGDTLHNFLDGLVIVAAFMVNVPLGIVTSLAVAAHEVPQEVADFSLFLAKGVKRAWVLVLNLVSSLATLVAAILAYFFWGSLAARQPQLLAFTAGMFLYIAGSDLIPELHFSYKKKRALLHLGAFLGGVVLMILVAGMFHH